ncbi:MAG: CPXCG motif-containing cysteine-rich protein [Acidobacteria bacterium]|jgi:transcription elongation factor Elf1|nr:MAG: CPXCG motif-containing cysteine-rich protein [Acidobacteriota bacterium]
MEEVVTFCCPSCLQHSALTVSLVRGRQSLVEDCQNCCAPIDFEIEVRDGEITRFEYSPGN